jgi:hypothetical protein
VKLIIVTVRGVVAVWLETLEILGITVFLLVSVVLSIVIGGTRGGILAWGLGGGIGGSVGEVGLEGAEIFAIIDLSFGLACEGKSNGSAAGHHFRIIGLV